MLFLQKHAMYARSVYQNKVRTLVVIINYIVYSIYTDERHTQTYTMKDILQADLLLHIHT